MSALERKGSGVNRKVRHAAWLADKQLRYGRCSIRSAANSTYMRAARSAAIVTLDVFDTALLRCVPQPADVFEIVGMRLEHAGSTFDAATFRRVRIESEVEARAIANEHGAEEVTLAEIYAVVGERFMQLDVACALEEELAVERGVLVINPDIKALYDALQSERRRVAFVSDTYLPEAFVAEMLHACGFCGQHDVIASSAVGATKEHGTLWPLLAARFGVAADQIVHLGDNVGADVRAALHGGVRAFWYRPAMRSSSTSRAIADKVLDRMAELAAGDRSGSEESRLLRNVTFAVVGPIFLGLGQWLAERVARDRIDRVLFCARDGFFLRETYERLAPFLALPPSVYLEVSRRALVFPSMNALDARALDVLCANNAPLEVFEYFDRIGIDIRTYPEELRAAELDPETRVYDQESRRRLRRLFTSMEIPVLDRARSERGLMLEYLDQSGAFSARRLAVVDIGWGGTLQQALAETLVSEGHTPDLHGYYLSTDERIENLSETAGPAQAWFANGARPEWMQVVISPGYWLLEIAFAAQHGTVLGYERSPNGQVAAVHHVYDPESPNARAARSIHAASVDLIERWIRIFGGVGPRLPMTAAFARFRRFVEHPTRDEARFFGDMVHIGGLGTTTEKLPIAAPPPMATYIKHPRLLINAYRESHWQLAFLQRTLGSNAAAGNILRLREAVRTARILLKQKVQRFRFSDSARS